MEQKTLNSEDVICPKLIYKEDSSFKLKSQDFTFNEDDLTLSFVRAQRDPEDTSINKHTNFVLTSKKKLSEIGQVNTNKVEHPDTFTTYLKFVADVGKGELFLGLDPGDKLYKPSPVEQVIARKSYTTEQNECYFTVNFIDHESCNIYHHDGYNDYYMTYLASEESVEFINVETVGPLQTFKYILDQDASRLSIMYYDGDNHILSWVEDDIVFVDPLESIDQNNIRIDIRYKEWTNTTIRQDNRWNSYNPNLIHTNQLEIDATKSYKNLECNNLLNIKYELFDGTSVPVDFITLKNQLTSEHLQSRNNPFNQYQDVDLRDYNKIYTGTNQVDGNDKISLGYENFTRNIPLEPGSLTHFHMPQDMYPYERINIGDSGLIEAGSIGSSSPLWSDKIFKKNASYKDSSHYGSVTGFENGEYLCSWLRYNTDKGIYEWVDRFYDVEEASFSQALSAASYASSLDGAEFTNDFIFDKTSELTLEPGALYAYYRVGKEDVKKIVGSFPNNIQNEFSTFAHGTGVVEQPTVVDDENIYVFNGMNIARTSSAPSINITSDLTYSFDIQADDWTQPLGHRLIDNYTHRGISVYNKQAVTPMIVIPNDDTLVITNSNFEVLSNTTLSAMDVKITDALGDIYAAVSNNGNTELHQLDIFGNTVKALALPQSVSTLDYNMDLDSEYAYFNMKWDPLSGGTEILRVPLSSTGGDFNILSGGALSASDEDKISSLIELSAWNGNDDTDKTTHISVISGEVTAGFGTSKDVDIYGNVWKIYNGELFKHEKGITNPALSVTEGTIKKAKTDIYGNVWVLYNDEILKMTNDRDVTFFNPLSSYDIPEENRSNTKAIDFIREFEEGSLNEYFLVFDQNGTTVHCHYFDMDGEYVKTNKIENITRDLSDDDISSFTGYDIVKRKYYKETTENKLYFKHRQVNPTDITDYIEAIFEVDVSDFTLGWQNFIFNTNTEKGTFDLYVNNIRHRIKTTGKLNRTDDTITSSFFVGTGAVPGNVSIQSFIKQPLHYLGTNFKVKNFKLFNDSLQQFDLSFLYRLSKRIESINWLVPGGGRQFIDTIDHFFKHRHPGYKTNLFRLVNVVNKEVATDDIKSQVATAVKEFVPVNSEAQEISWVLN